MPSIVDKTPPKTAEEKRLEKIFAATSDFRQGVKGAGLDRQLTAVPGKFLLPMWDGEVLTNFHPG